MQKLLLGAIALFTTFAAQAQSAKGTVYTAPLQGVVVFSELEEDIYNARILSLEAPNPDGNIDKIRLRDAKLEVARRFPYATDTKARSKTTAAQSPVVVQSFTGDSLSGIPPDNDMAISKANKAVNVMNSNIAVLDGNAGTMLKRSNLKPFSAAVGLNDIMSDYRYDPKVVYDADADRFICVMLNSTNRNNYIVIGFTLTNDPMGGWSFYKFQGDYKADTTWFDYPAISITKDEIFLTGNKIKDNVSWQLGFSETVIYQINKKNGYDSAATLNYKIWDGIKHEGRPIRNLFPVKAGWLPESNEQYFLSNRNFDVQNDTIFLVKVPGTIANGGDLSVQVLKSPVSYGVPPNGRQPDTGYVLATNDGRVLGAYCINDEIQFVSTSVHPVSGASAIFHGKITNYKTSPAITHTAFLSIDTLDYGYPNISFVGNNWGLNQSMITFNYTGPSDFPGLGAMLYDGLQYSDLVKVKTGEGYIQRLGGKEQRWGDYSGSQVDFNSLGGVWIVGIYGRTDKSYGIRMAKLNSPVLGVEQVKEKAPDNQLFPNPVNTYVSYKFSLASETAVTFAIYNIDGRLVDNLITKKCKQGSNLIEFNTASLPAGTYILKGVYNDGGEVMTERFVKQ